MTKEECLNALEYLEKLEAEKDCCDEKSTVLNQLIFEHFDENGNVRAFANICVDEDKLIEICKEAAENVKEKFVDRYEKMLDKACEFLAESHVKESGWSNKDKWKEWLEKQVE